VLIRRRVNSVQQLVEPTSPSITRIPDRYQRPSASHQNPNTCLPIRRNVLPPFAFAPQRSHRPINPRKTHIRFDIIISTRPPDACWPSWHRPRDPTDLERRQHRQIRRRHQLRAERQPTDQLVQGRSFPTRGQRAEGLHYGIGQRNIGIPRRRRHDAHI